MEFRRLLDEHNALKSASKSKAETLFTSLHRPILIGDDWTPVMRYDTAHGYAHCDILHPHEPAVKVRLPHSSYKEALTWALHDLETNWQLYSERYYRWL